MVYVLEELVEPAHWDSNAGTLKCRMKLLLIQLSIAVPVYCLEEQKELPLSCLNEGSELYAALASIALTTKPRERAHGTPMHAHHHIVFSHRHWYPLP